MDIAGSLEKKYQVKFEFEAKEIITNSFKKFEIAKGEYLLRENQIEKYLYYLQQGVIKVWMLDDKGREAILQFAFKDNLFNSYKSMITKMPSEFNIQAIYNCVGWKIEASVILSLLDTSFSTNIMARKMMEDIIWRQQQRELFFLTKDATAKYIAVETLIQKYKIPLKDIASYIGVASKVIFNVKKKIKQKS